MTRRSSESYNRLLETDNNYNFTHKKRGLAIIINNINFSPDCGLPVRKCAENDHKKVEKVFRALNFRVETCLDLTADDMVDKMREVACNINYDHTAADCFVCTVLTHGGQLDLETDVSSDVLLGVDGKNVYTRDLVSPFRDETCPYLHGKPKLFFIEACRHDDLPIQEPVPEDQVSETLSDGSSESKVANCVDEESQTTVGNGVAPKEEQSSQLQRKKRTFCGESVIHTTILPTPLYKDFLVMYATPPGYSSGWSRTGSHFACDLEQVFAEKAVQQSSFLFLLVRLCNRMITSLMSQAQEGEQEEEIRREEETLPLPLPCVMSMLTKDLFFRK